MGDRDMLVAVAGDGQLLGTASLEGDQLKALFVHPKAQGLGIGRALLGAVTEIARSRGAGVVQLQSSLTAIGFYRAQGFRGIREIVDGDDRTLLMERAISQRGAGRGDAGPVPGRVMVCC